MAFAIIFLVAILSPAIFYIEDWPGWVLALASFLTVFCSKSIRSSASLVIIVWTSLVLRHAIACYDTYVGSIYGDYSDAFNFHVYAAEVTVTKNFYFAIGSQFFRQMLGRIYDLLEPSFFLGHQISIFVFSLCFPLIFKICDELGISRHRASIAMLFGLLPSSLLYTSLPLREAWQLFFFMLLAIGCIRYKKTASISYFFLMIASALAMSLFHQGLLVACLFILPIVIFWPVRRGRPPVRTAILGLVGVLSVPATFIVNQIWPIPRFNAILEPLTGDIFQQIHELRKIGGHGRTTYGVLIARSPSVFSGLCALALMFAYYLFAPFPWKVDYRYLTDIYAIGESILRMALLGSAFIWLRRLASSEADEQKKLVKMLLVIYFCTAFVWSIGTVNMGTAMRHNLTHQWILIILGGPVLFDGIARLLKRISNTLLVAPPLTSPTPLVEECK